MELSGARLLGADATGAPGGAITAEPADRGARVALAGRDRGSLAHTARAYPGAPTAGFDAYDPGSCARAVHEAAAALQGLDVVAFGSVAFGAAEEIGGEAAEHLMAVNHLAPAVFSRAVLGILRSGSAIAAVTGASAECPQPRMADHSASRAALAAWLDAVRREARSAGVAVLEIRPGHLDTGFATRPVAGTAPPLPEGGDPRHVAGAVADAPETGAELLRPSPGKSPVLERRAR
ncbi:SDR family NAD(P)-dependent oxidoreductase [Streptomyces sp. NPDC002561]|uniref:SDR family NAD(P)-dependent oxidoreductase n=1 Tax=Streptomyces sp. NPDC002561 TaxID=3154418 RepID=UPI0033348A82